MDEEGQSEVRGRSRDFARAALHLKKRVFAKFRNASTRGAARAVSETPRAGFARKSADAPISIGSRAPRATRPGVRPAAGREATAANRTRPARASSFPSALGRAGDDDGRVPVGKIEHLFSRDVRRVSAAGPMAKTPRRRERRAGRETHRG